MDIHTHTCNWYIAEWLNLDGQKPIVKAVSDRQGWQFLPRGGFFPGKIWFLPSWKKYVSSNFWEETYLFQAFQKPDYGPMALVKGHKQALR